MPRSVKTCLITTTPTAMSAMMKQTREQEFITTSFPPKSTCFTLYTADRHSTFYVLHSAFCILRSAKYPFRFTLDVQSGLSGSFYPFLLLVTAIFILAQAVVFLGC